MKKLGALIIMLSAVSLVFFPGCTPNDTGNTGGTTGTTDSGDTGTGSGTTDDK